MAEAFRQSHSDQIAQIIGRDISLFEVRMRLGFALATNPNATPNEVVKGLRIAETAHQGLIDFRSKLGFYDHRPLANSLNDDADGQSSDNDFLADCAENIVNAVFAALQRCDEQDETG